MPDSAPKQKWNFDYVLPGPPGASIRIVMGGEPSILLRRNRDRQGHNRPTTTAREGRPAQTSAGGVYGAKGMSKDIAAQQGTQLNRHICRWFCPGLLGGEQRQNTHPKSSRSHEKAPCSPLDIPSARNLRHVGGKDPIWRKKI
jgi:hypothetical protein